MSDAAPLSPVLPDALPSNWVDRHAPAALRPWLKLGRFDRPTGIWLLMLPGWQGLALAGIIQAKWPDPWFMLLFFLGAALMRAAGCAYNDIVDRDIDAKVARSAMRPIPSGQISVKAAFAFTAACALAALVILLQFNAIVVVLGVASLALVAVYPFMKRITWWPQAWLGLTFNWGVLMGAAAMQYGFGGGDCLTNPGMCVAFFGSESFGAILQSVGPAALLLYLSGVFWTLGYDTIYAIQDLEDDALAGVKSSARRLGDKARGAVLAFYAVTLILVLAAARIAHAQVLFYPLFVVFALHLGWQVGGVNVKDGAGALRLFKSNSWAGLILAAGLALGHIRLAAMLFD